MCVSYGCWDGAWIADVVGGGWVAWRQDNERDGGG